jgi:cation-transporting ATPase E
VLHRPLSLFQRGDDEPARDEPSIDESPDDGPSPDAPGSEEREAREAGNGDGPKFLGRLRSRVTTILRRDAPDSDADETPESEPLHETVFLFAYHPDLVPLHGDSGLPQVPLDLVPLCNLRYSEQVRPDAIETIRAFTKMGVSIKAFTSGAPERTASILGKAGLGSDDREPLLTITGAELAALGPEAFTRAVEDNTVYGEITPELAGGVVEALRSRGRSVVAVGDGVNDLPALQEASLAIARRSSSQAALSVADIVVLDDSPQVLQNVVEKGQRIVNGLLDVLKLYLTQVFYLTLLIIALALTIERFPYLSKQGSIIAIVTLSLPSVGLSLWASPGAPRTSNLGRLLAFFVGPAMAVMGGIALVMYMLVLDRTGDVDYTQLIVTYTLVACGLLLVLFVRPPWRSRVGAGSQAGDIRPTVLVLVLWVLFVLVAFIPLSYQLFGIEPLREMLHYALVGLAVLAMALGLAFLLRVAPLVDSPRARRDTEDE